jgi:hypothetical protein
LSIVVGPFAPQPCPVVSKAFPRSHRL